MTEEQIKIELRKINEGEDWNSLFNYIMLLEQDIRNLIAQRDEREKETIKLKKDIVKATTNWNEFKNWLEEKRKETKICNCTTRSYLRRVEQFIAMQNKMQEMEGK